MTTLMRTVLPVAGVAVMLATCLYLLADSGKKDAALPRPSKAGKLSFEEVLAARRSVRRFRTDAMTLEQISQLCWAAQGITEPKRGLRTCPSAGALYPLELYVVTADAVEYYLPKSHSMETHLAGDLRGKLQAAALNQQSVGTAPAVFVITAVTARTQKKYGDRAERYVMMEAGHAGQNILLQAQSLGLGAVPVGAFDDDKVADALSLPKDCAPLYLIPVGAAAE